MRLADDILNGAEEAAAFTGLKRRAIYHMVRTKRVPHCYAGTRLIFRKTELERYFSSEPPTPSPPAEPRVRESAGLSRQEMVRLVAHVCEIPEARQRPFNERINVLLKSKMFRHCHTGKGNHAAYSTADLWRVIFANQFCLTGCSVRSAVEHTERFESLLLNSVAGRFRCWLNFGEHLKVFINTPALARRLAAA